MRSLSPVDARLRDRARSPRWGIVSARPSEYLVHVRSGAVRAASSGQGAWCFKLPSDSVTLIPTSIRRLQFVADQVTLERVGVEVTGLAVYRVAEPLLAYRMLDVDEAGGALEPLTQILREMFVGACRRLVANLPLEVAMTRRKEALAHELMAEIAPVLEGAWRLHDTSHQGWGVVVDTIEIQNVRILSQQVFEGMQAEFRADLDRRREQASLTAQVEVARQRAEAEERARLEAIARQRRVLDAEKALARARHAEALEQATLRAELEEAEQRMRFEAEARARAAEREAVEHALALERAKEEQRLRTLEAELTARNVVAPARVRQQLVEGLPEVARALAGAVSG